VRRADRIIVFHAGKMTEQGSHEKLLALDGKYAELYREQAQWYT
jgi:ATP-binding cassette subfamily B protein